ncbi:polyprenyl synthetase family protein [Streptomyces sp. NPDC053728]|uniref:polyprenyl synthetase family protein n=1 Tax=Streptomyces sp. NPDC053728 TaxID=3155534 RepID=UPI00341ED143
MEPWRNPARRRPGQGGAWFRVELTLGGFAVGTVDEVLRSAGDACEKQLRGWVGSLEGPAAQVAAYQFGWSGEGARQGGKYVRAALTLACTRAVGGVDRRAVPAAAAVEMVHNLSLLYDDVLDGDTVRRHRAAAWQVFGPSSAARSADAMMLTAFDVLSESDGPDGPVAREASAALVDVLIQLAVGESLDLVFEGRTQVTLAECLEMVSGKTASLFACACRLGPPPNLRARAVGWCNSGLVASATQLRGEGGPPRLAQVLATSGQQSGHRPVQPQPTAQNRPTDSVGGPSETSRSGLTPTCRRRPTSDSRSPCRSATSFPRRALPQGGTEPCAERSTEGQRNHCRVKCHICEVVGELGLGSSRSGA